MIATLKKGWRFVKKIRFVNFCDYPFQGTYARYWINMLFLSLIIARIICVIKFNYVFQKLMYTSLNHVLKAVHQECQNNIGYSHFKKVYLKPGFYLNNINTAIIIFNFTNGYTEEKL